MLITELSEYKGDTWQLEVDGRKRLYVNAAVIEEYSLKEGQNIAPSELSAVMGTDALRKAKKRALYLIGERELCRGELLKKLTRTYGGEIAEQAVEYVCELGYIDDERYAPKLAEYLIRRKRWGIRRVRYEMLSRGLESELVENTLADIDAEELDEELTTLIEKRYITKLADYDDRRRTIAALARRGYDFGSIKRCIDAVLESNEEDDEEQED